MFAHRVARNMNKDRQGNGKMSAVKKRMSGGSGSSENGRAPRRTHDRMSKNGVQQKIDLLFQREAWNEARTLLKQEQAKDPDNHWLLTQIGVTLYEQRRYGEALKQFVRSVRILPDCPLTLWNLAGTLDALGRPTKAIPIYI